MDKTNIAARRASAENLPRAQRLRLAHPADRKAAREDRKAVTTTHYWARGNQLAQAMLVKALDNHKHPDTLGHRVVRVAKRLVKQAESRA